jgi:GNAT superfamily N-acetyltransferase
MLQNVEIRRPKNDDAKELHHFFSTVIHDTFNKEGIGEKLDDIKDEIKVKEKYLQSDLESHGERRYFLIAIKDHKIVGSIEYGPSSELIRSCTNNDFKELIEVGTVFVHPDFQRNGIVNMLLNAIYMTLQEKGIEEFCLDSGYISAQKIWKKKFGEPDYLLTDYWGVGYDHMIWRVKVSDCIK